MRRSTLFLGIFLTTLATLVLELALTRLFSATMYYHFAFMAISLALFGAGASGVFVYLFQDRFAAASTSRGLAISSSLFAIGTVSALYVILQEPLTLKAGMGNYYRLAMIYTASAIPFFFSGCTVTLAITRYANDINRLYLFDLLGAACGCLLLIPLLNVIGAVNTILFVSVSAGGAALLFAASGGTPSVVAACGIVAAGMLGLSCYNGATGRLGIHKAKGVTEEALLFSKWNSLSRITVSGNLHAGRVKIKIDSGAASDIVKNASDIEAHQDQRHSIEALAYGLKPRGNVLIIGPGGGSDVMAARVWGMRHVTAVEVNPIIAKDVMSSEPFKTFSGSIYEQPGVRLVVDEGRSFIRSSPDSYDIIQATMVDTWAATAAGAFALTENNLYTVEAFEDYVTHLSSDGILTMTRWYFEPPEELLRLISITRAMMSGLGISSPERHIMIVRRGFTEGHKRTVATFLFKRSAFTDSEVAEVEDVARAEHFVVLYTPATRPDGLFSRLIEAPDPSTVWNAFQDDITPSRDNNPFFFNSIRLSRILALRDAHKWEKTNLGTVILLGLLAITAVMVLVFILGPLVIAGRDVLAVRSAMTVMHLLYFGCVGAGFIIVEVAMMQKFILFLGYPVYALTVILFSLLSFSALGSYTSRRLGEERLVASLGWVLVLLAGMIGVYVCVLPPIVYGFVRLARPVRILIAVVLMAPLALVMGMPMPTGIRVLAKSTPGIIPWAWGVNGASSVLGSVGALVIALVAGFNQALLVGAALYVAAAFFVTRGARAQRGEAGGDTGFFQADWERPLEVDGEEQARPRQYGARRL